MDKKFALPVHLPPNSKFVNFSKFSFSPSEEKLPEELKLVVDIRHEDHGLVGQIGYPEEPTLQEKVISLAEALANLTIYGKAIPASLNSKIQPIAFDPAQGDFYKSVKIFSTPQQEDTPESTEDDAN